MRARRGYCCVLEDAEGKELILTTFSPEDQEALLNFTIFISTFQLLKWTKGMGAEKIYIHKMFRIVNSLIRNTH